MLLIEFTINGTLTRVSQEGIALTHYWDAKVIEFDPIQYKIAQYYGGYVELGYGSISFFPDLFNDDWPPPVNGLISIYYTATTEAAKELLFIGTAHLTGVDREAVTYRLAGPVYDETVASATAYNNDLETVLNGILTGIAEIDTLDVTYGRVAVPNVTHTTSGDKLAIDLASDIAAFYSHLFYIVGTTAYLVDMLLNTGETTYTEFDFFPSQYDYLEPVAVARTGAFSQFSAYPYGRDMTVTQYHDTQANAEAALVNIMSVWHKPRARFRIPLLGSIPTPGKKLSWTDTAQGQDTDMYIMARSIQYDFDNEEAIIDGEGAISAG